MSIRKVAAQRPECFQFYVRAGFISKKPSDNPSGNWVERFFVARGGFLFYYHPQRETKTPQQKDAFIRQWQQNPDFNLHPLGAVPLSGATITGSVATSDSKEKQFIVEIHSHSFQFFLRAVSEPDQREWIEALCTCALATTYFFEDRQNHIHKLSRLVSSQTKNIDRIIQLYARLLEDESVSQELTEKFDRERGNLLTKVKAERDHENRLTEDEVMYVHRSDEPLGKIEDQTRLISMKRIQRMVHGAVKVDRRVGHMEELNDETQRTVLKLNVLIKDKLAENEEINVSDLHEDLQVQQQEYDLLQQQLMEAGERVNSQQRELEQLRNEHQEIEAEMVQLVELETQSREMIEAKLHQARQAFNELKQSLERMYPVGRTPVDQRIRRQSQIAVQTIESFFDGDTRQSPLPQVQEVEEQ